MGPGGMQCKVHEVGRHLRRTSLNLVTKDRQQGTPRFEEEIRLLLYDKLVMVSFAFRADLFAKRRIAL